jgi:Antirepressor regulating drug resistance, predicted signal transduction N-terminal membrane component
MTILNEPVVRALAWALAHSLWQGALAVLLLLFLLPRLKGAAQRYWAAYGTLMAVLASAVITFFVTYEPLAETGPPLVFAGKMEAAAQETALFEASETTSVGEWASLWLETNYPAIVGLWAIGFSFFFVRVLLGLWQLRRLRRHAVSALDGAWQDAFAKLRGRLGLNKTVSVWESGLARSPMTIGWLKPVVLLPLGLVNHLSPAEVEAILAHELAHIARKDWLFNLFQAMAETVFYYHPAVWWLSGVINRERENACDDLAIRVTSNPMAFARALVQVQEMAFTAPALALALQGKRRRPMLDRVRRILNQPPQQYSQAMEKVTATIILLAFLALVGIRANSLPNLESALAQVRGLPELFFQNETGIEADSLPKPKGIRKISREDENGQFEVEYRDGQLTRLTIDGREVPPAEFDQHQALVEELMQGMPVPPSPPLAPLPPLDLSAAPPAPLAFDFNFDAPDAPGSISIVTDEDGQGNTIIRMDQGGKTTEMRVKKGEVWIDGKRVEKGEPVEVPRGEMPPFRFGEIFEFNVSPDIYTWIPDVAHDLGLTAKQRDEMRREMEEAHREMKKSLEETRRSLMREKKEMDREWQQQQKEWEKEQRAWEKEQRAWEKEQRAWEREQQAYESRNRAVEDVLKTELLRDGLISTPAKFSVSLSDKEFKVNGKKQTEEMRRKYVELVQAATGQKWSKGTNYQYNYSETE